MKLLLILLIFVLASVKANAGILLPWNPIFKLNLGVDYLKPSVRNTVFNKTDVASDLFRFRNANAYIGVRAFKYFGVELGQSKIIKSTTDYTFNSNLKYTDFKLFLPILDILPISSILPFSIDLYASYGIASLNSYKSQPGIGNTNSNVGSSSKYGVGAEFSTLGIASVRVGQYWLDKKIDILNNNRLSVFYIGGSIYLF